MSTFSGRFVWRTLITPQPAALAEFYGAVFGWSATSVPMGGPTPYTMFRLGTHDIGGGAPPAMDGVPSHWIAYLSVDDVDAAVNAVPGLGGKVLLEAKDLPNVGRFAVVADPTGAYVTLFRGVNPGATDTESKAPAGTFCWSQLMTTDVDRAVPFYTALVGWTPAPAGGGVTTFSTGEVMRATMMALPKDGPTPSHWLNYIAVDNCDASFARAVEAGATAYHPPTDMPGMGRFAVLADPSGAVFALWKSTN